MSLDEVQKLKAQIKKNIKTLEKKRAKLLSEPQEIIDTESNLQIQRDHLEEVRKYKKV